MFLLDCIRLVMFSNFAFYANVGGYSPNATSPTMGYLNNGSLQAGQINYTFHDVYANVNEGMGNARKTYNESTNWTAYTGTGLTAISETFYSSTFGTWLGKNGKFYDQSWGGNGFTGGKFKFGKNLSTTFKWGGNVLGLYNAGVIYEEYNAGNINTAQFALEEASNAYSTLGGIYGAAWGIGWEAGRYVTQQSWYQQTKYDFWSNMWQIRYGVPSYQNQHEWNYFYNNYQP